MISTCVLNSKFHENGWDLKRGKRCLYETDEGPDDVNDREKVLRFGHIDANREIRLFPLHGLEEELCSGIRVLQSPLAVCLQVRRGHRVK